MKSLFAAIDVGGTKTAVGILDGDMNLLKEGEFPTRPEKGCRDLVDRVHTYCNGLLHDLGGDSGDVTGLCVLTPGPVDTQAGVIRHIPTMGWRNEPILAMFRERFGCPVVLEHDVSGAALGEYRFGAGRGADRCLAYMTVSTGVGCGILTDGGIFRGAQDAAGELGHVKVVPGGRPCSCGGRGCLEAYASGTAIAAIASEQCGRALTTSEVFDLAASGNAEMQSIVWQAGALLGYAVSLLCQIVDPSRVILGGSVSKRFAALEPSIREAAAEHTQSFESRGVEIVPSRFAGHENALLGAGCLARLAFERGPR